MCNVFPIRDQQVTCPSTSRLQVVSHEDAWKHCLSKLLKGHANALTAAWLRKFTRRELSARPKFFKARTCGGMGLSMGCGQNVQLLFGVHIPKTNCRIQVQCHFTHPNQHCEVWRKKTHVRASSRDDHLDHSLAVFKTNMRNSVVWMERRSVAHGR